LGTAEQSNVDLDGGGRWYEDMLIKEQTTEKCGNMRIQGNFGREGFIQ